MDPRRNDPIRHPAVRLYGEYIWAYAAAIYRAPLSAADKRECYRCLTQWLATRRRPGATAKADPPIVAQHNIQIDAVVAGRQGKR